MARQALDAEKRLIATAEPLDAEAFRRQQAAFAAHRLSPESSEEFFRHALPFVRGKLNEFTVQAPGGASYPAFDVILPSEWQTRRRRSTRVSFWPEACSNDNTQENAVLYIAPGNWLFDAVIEQVIVECRLDLEQGAVFADLPPEGESPYLVLSGKLPDGWVTGTDYTLLGWEITSSGWFRTPMPS